MATKLNNAFTAQSYVIIHPFERSVNQYGNAVYTGVVKDGENTLVPYVHNMTFEEAKNRNDSLTRFDAYVAQALKHGYAQVSNFTGLWIGTMGNMPNPAKEAVLRINASNTGIQVGSVGNAVSLSNYVIEVDYKTKE